MRVAIIGRTEALLDTAVRALAHGHEIGLVITSKEAPEYRATADDFAALAEANGAPFIRTARITAALDAIKAAPPCDIALSVNYAGVIPQEVVDCFPLGILNAHGGDLPRYRGNACQAWAIVNEESQVGLCIHRMIGGELDSGDIVGYDTMALTIRTKVGHILEWINGRIPDMMVDAAEAISRDPNWFIRKQSLDPQAALRCYPRTPADGRIDWTKSSSSILRLINASGKPYPGAFCFWEDKKLTVWDAELVEDGELFLAIPGQVTRIGAGLVEIATGEGKIALSSVEAEGRACTPDALIQSLRSRLL